MRFHERQRVAAGQDELGWPLLPEREGDLVRVSPVDEDKRGVERVDGRTGGNNDPALMIADVALHGDGGIEQAAGGL